MQVQVSGKHVDVGEALRSRIVTELSNGIGKYFERGGDADVVVTREGNMFRVDSVVTLASGQQLVGSAYGSDAHGAFDGMLERIEKRVRRYKRRLKNHHASNGKSGQETAPVTVLRAPDEVLEEDFDDHLAEAEGQGAPAAMIIAETQHAVRTMTVSMAVMDLDLSNYPVLLFRNAAHGGLAVVYRRPDGNIGWIDPERMRGSGDGSQRVRETT